MKINALIMDINDNVATCTREILSGETVLFLKNGELVKIIAKEMVPYCHKVAIAPIKKGECVFKYGEIIGVATEDISIGGWVYHENIESLPRDYDSEFI